MNKKALVESVLTRMNRKTAAALAQMERLRPIRLHHWREYLHECRREKAYTSFKAPKHAEAAHARATFHMHAVQTLNDFFPIGDTAERDSEKEQPCT